LLSLCVSHFDIVGLSSESLNFCWGGGLTEQMHSNPSCLLE
jgi:hypothetical protein